MLLLQVTALNQAINLDAQTERQYNLRYTVCTLLAKFQLQNPATRSIAQ